MRLNLDRILSAPLPPVLKGLPPCAVGLPLSELRNLDLCLLKGDLPLPAAVIQESALDHNIRWMKDFTGRAGVSLCPHGKTTMSPQLFDRQLQAGCWGMSAATASHVRTYRTFGVQRIILANQLVGRANIDLVLDELESDKDFDFYCLIDSLDGLKELADAATQRHLDRPIQVLLEVGLSGGRAGVRSIEDGVALGRALRNAAPTIALRGIELFEGIVGSSDQSDNERQVRAMLETLGTIAAVGRDESWFAPGELILSAGGTSFFDIAATVLNSASTHMSARVVLRSGCYLTHDSLYFSRQQPRMRERSGALWGDSDGLQNALQVWACVQSVPESHRAICGLGKRDISHDMVLPQPLLWFRQGEHSAPQPVANDLHVTALNDQHAYVDSSGDSISWRVGDLVGFGVAHPCTTFDKWPLIFTIDDDYRILDGLRTFF